MTLLFFFFTLLYVIHIPFAVKAYNYSRPLTTDGRCGTFNGARCWFPQGCSSLSYCHHYDWQWTGAGCQTEFGFCAASTDLNYFNNRTDFVFNKSLAEEMWSNYPKKTILFWGISDFLYKKGLRMFLRSNDSTIAQTVIRREQNYFGSVGDEISIFDTSMDPVGVRVAFWNSSFLGSNTVTIKHGMWRAEITCSQTGIPRGILISVGVASSFNNSWGDGVCPYGYEPVNGTTTCSECQIGYYKTDIGNFPCTKCPGNTFTSATGAISSSSCGCPSGQFNDNNTCISCPLGTFKTTGFDNGTSCTPCVSGTTQNIGSTSSTMCGCAAGQYLNGSTCSQCPVGTWKGLFNANTSCTPCAGGTTQNTSATSSTMCGCPAGQYLNDSTCTQCPVGTFKPSFDASTSCTACGGGTTQNTGATSSAECVCPAGQYLVENVCTQCPVGTFRTSLNTSSSCIACGFGTTQSTGSTAPSACGCPAGQYLNGNTCTACPLGTFKSATFDASTSCTTCTSGTTQSTGATSSSACGCPPDHYLNGAVCTKCPPGTYKSTFDVNTICTSCSVDFDSNACEAPNLDEKKAPDNGSSKTWIYVGVALGGGVIIIGSTVFVINRSRRRRREKSFGTAQQMYPPNPPNNSLLTQLQPGQYSSSNTGWNIPGQYPYPIPSSSQRIGSIAANSLPVNAPGFAGMSNAMQPNNNSFAIPNTLHPFNTYQYGHNDNSLYGQTGTFTIGNGYRVRPMTSTLVNPLTQF